ncbi:MAG TPA: aminopeptidase P N-terminal domain-containing protein [Holophagaceae bacterium]|nr:aminopeptidase P N-terminal domain-containing protein [Holophagaceae bacterium]
MRLPASFFAGNRARLLQGMKAMGPGTLAVIKSMPVQPANGDSDHAYRQDSDFYYLTGVEEENAVALIDGDTGKYTLLVQPRDPKRETWTGPRLGVDGAKAMGADEAFAFDEGEAGPGSSAADKALASALRNAKRIVFIDNFDEAFRDRILDAAYPKGTRNWNGGDKILVDGRATLAEMRVIKQPAEIDMIRKAVEVSIEGHLAAMKGSPRFVNEGQVAGAFEGAVRSLGARFLAYDTIAGAGNDGCTLHYPFNDQPITPGSLVLMDAGAELGFYASDITRTWPAGGTYSSEQRALYDLVLKAQDAGIAEMKVGNPHIASMYAATRIISDGLVDLGILQGDKEEVYKKMEWKRFLPHGVSHWVGLDVHDAGSYGKGDAIYPRGGSRKLEPGMVLTMEPGIYIPKGAEGVDPKWQGIGIRIEDDILITAGGPENLSARLPRKAEEVERVVRQGLKKR